MSTNVNVLKNFLIHDLGIHKLDKKEARDLDIDMDKFSEADVDENEELDIDEILNNNELYKDFEAMFVAQVEKDKESETEDKEDKIAIQAKGGCGTA